MHLPNGRGRGPTVSRGRWGCGMNPILASLVAELEAKGMQVAVGALTLLAKDLLAGKSLPDTLTDLAETAADDMVALEDKALKAAGL